MAIDIFFFTLKFVRMRTLMTSYCRGWGKAERFIALEKGKEQLPIVLV